MLRWALGILPGHSDFECSDGYSAIHRSIQISNAQADIGHSRSIRISNAQTGIVNSTWAFRFWMRRWALGIPPEHSDFKYSDGHWAFPSERSDYACSDGHWAFHPSRFWLLRWALSMSLKHSDFECSDGHWTFHQGIQIVNVQMDVDILPKHADFECSDGHWKFHLNIQISNAQMSIGQSILAFKFKMLRWALGI